MVLSELRWDYLHDRFVVVRAENGSSNGSDSLQMERDGEEKEDCPYCPGNEHLTPPAVIVMMQHNGVYRMQREQEGSYIKDWCVRVFPSDDPHANVGSGSGMLYGDQPFYREPANGFHYVVIATPLHEQELTTMSVDQWVNVLLVIQDRAKWLYSQKHVKYISIYAGFGEDPSPDPEHAHLNLVTFPRVPPTILQEAEVSKRLMENQGTCPVCDIIEAESGGPREVLSTKNFLAVCPWASANPYEFWIVPRAHLSTLSSMSQTEMSDLALMLRSSLGGLERSLKNSHFNLAFHLSPERKNNMMIHWHIEVCPQVSNWSGFGHAFGLYMNTVSPEHAAQVLRSSCRKEFAVLVGVR